MGRQIADRRVDPGQHAVDFFNNYLRHTKGIWAGKLFNLEEWQREQIIRPLFGSIGPDGYRQYRTAYVEIPRKNGKSEVAAGVALKLLTADGEPGAEVYGAAADKDQASIVFNVAKVMVDMDPHLRKRVKVYRSRVMEVPKTGSVYKVLSADAFTKHGLNAHGIVFDEVHAQPNRELWDVLTTSVGARQQPLTFAITTAGYDKKSICYELHQYGLKILRGEVDDPSFFAFISYLPEDLDWRDEKNWHVANPALGAFRGVREMRDMAIRAAESPALQNTFRRLYLNQWTSQDTRWLDMVAWDRPPNSDPIDETQLKGMDCYAGLDLASTIDIAALNLVFPVMRSDEEGNSYLEDFKSLWRFWIPEETVEQRSKKDGVPYDQWVDQGLMKATPGNVIDYNTIMDDILALREEYNLMELGYDRWNATQLIINLMDKGVVCTPIGQGFAGLSAPCKDLLTFVLQGIYNHGGNPVARWMADNVAVEQDPAGNIKPSKKKSTEKIDGIVAAIMGIDRAVRNGYGPSVYERRGLAILGPQEDE